MSRRGPCAHRRWHTVAGARTEIRHHSRPCRRAVGGPQLVARARPRCGEVGSTGSRHESVVVLDHVVPGAEASELHRAGGGAVSDPHGALRGTEVHSGEEQTVAERRHRRDEVVAPVGTEVAHELDVGRAGREAVQRGTLADLVRHHDGVAECRGRSRSRGPRRARIRQCGSPGREIGLPQAVRSLAEEQRRTHGREHCGTDVQAARGERHDASRRRVRVPEPPLRLTRDEREASRHRRELVGIRSREIDRERQRDRHRPLAAPDSVGEHQAGTVGGRREEEQHPVERRDRLERRGAARWRARHEDDRGAARRAIGAPEAAERLEVGHPSDGHEASDAGARASRVVVVHEPAARWRAVADPELRAVDAVVDRQKERVAEGHELVEGVGRPGVEVADEDGTTGSAVGAPELHPGLRRGGREVRLPAPALEPRAVEPRADAPAGARTDVLEDAGPRLRAVGLPYLGAVRLVPEGEVERVSQGNKTARFDAGVGLVGTELGHYGGPGGTAVAPPQPCRPGGRGAEVEDAVENGQLERPGAVPARPEVNDHGGAGRCAVGAPQLPAVRPVVAGEVQLVAERRREAS